MAKTKKRSSSTSSKNQTSSPSQPPQPQKIPYNWIDFLSQDHNVSTAPVYLFSNLKIAPHWQNLVSINLKVETFNPDAVLPSDVKSINDCFWIANVVRVAGFFVCLRWEGYEKDDEHDFWMLVHDSNIHPVGYAQANNKYLLPPRDIMTKQNDWRKYLFTHLLGSHTLPIQFREYLTESFKSEFQIGMHLEAIDINRVSAVRPATVCEIKGTRLHIGYDSSKPLNYTNSIWCDQRSNLIHPVGWAQLVGHELKSTKMYANDSLKKLKTGDYEDLDCDFSYFPHLYAQMKEPYLPNESEKFKEGMRIEAIDALNMRTVNIATVYKVLRYDYLMIGVDGMTAEDGSDAFCYYRSDCLPINYCKKYKIPLTLPEGCEKKKFNYPTYLKEANAIAAPETLFKNDEPDPSHSFKPGMYLEAADLMEPHLICPAFVKQVAGKLLKISFCGWPDYYDQWLDYRCADIYPMGYCAVTGYNLEQPKNTLANSEEECLEELNAQIFKSTPKSSSKSKAKRSRKATSKQKSSKKQKVGGGKSIEKIRELNATHSNSFETELRSLSDNIMITPDASFSSKTSDFNQTNPLLWSVEEVVKFLNSNGLEQYSHLFVESEINGARLVKMTSKEIYEMIGKELDPSLILHSKVCELKEYHQIT